MSFALSLPPSMRYVRVCILVGSLLEILDLYLNSVWMALIKSLYLLLALIDSGALCSWWTFF